MTDAPGPVTPIKVAITLANFETIWGYVYLHREQRLQDLMNDDRAFLPVDEASFNQGDDRYRNVVLQKTGIIKIREIA